MTIWTLLTWLLLIIGIAMLVYYLYFWWIRRQSAKILTPSEFDQHRYRAQVIDVREAEEFQSRHILGARNIPYSQVKTGMPGLNRSQDILLYDNGMILATRMAKHLKDLGYENIYILDGGFNEWRGEVKEAK